MAYNVFSGTLNPAQATPLLVFTCHMGSHSVIIGSSVLSPGRGDIPAFLKLVLDLATPEGCKAELT